MRSSRWNASVGYVVVVRPLEGIEQAREIDDRRDVRDCSSPLLSCGVRAAVISASSAGLAVSDSIIEALWPSERISVSWPSIRQDTCSCGMRSRHFSLTLMARLRASSGIASFTLSWLSAVELAQFLQIDLEPRAIEARLVQLLRGAHERARAALHGAHQRAEAVARRGREEHQRLLGAFRHGDRRARPCGTSPSTSRTGEPVVGRRDSWRRAGTRRSAGISRTVIPGSPP